VTDRKRDDDFTDLTVPVPVKDSKAATDEDVAQPSFDDDVAKRKIPARPARTEKSKPAPVEVEFPAPSDTNQFMQAVFAGAGEAVAGRAARSDRVSTKKLPKPVEVSSEEEEPTFVSRDLNPDENTEAAPIANPDDAESAVTAPIPMMSGLTREMLRDDEPSIPNEPPPEVIVNGVGDGIEREPAAPTTTPEPPIDHTPIFRPAATPETEIVERDDEDITSPNLEPPARSRAPLFIAGTLLGLAFAALLVVAVIALTRATAPDATTTTGVKPSETATTTAATVSATATKPNEAAKTTTASATEVKPCDAEAKPNEVAATTPPPAATEAKPSDLEAKANEIATTTAPTAGAVETKASEANAATTPPSGAVETKANQANAPTTTTTKPVAAEAKEDAASLPEGSAPAKVSAPAAKESAAVVTPATSLNVRRADGFGPFVDHTGLGLGATLEGAARSIVGSLDGTEVGVRGEVLHVDTSKKDKTTAVECAFTVFDKTGGRARMGATAKGAKASEASQACAQSLASELKSAVARVRGP
jgi:hypothetical protein